MQTKYKTQVIAPKSIESKEAFGDSTIWNSGNFSQDWFDDTVREARDGTDHNAIRREIVFATSFLESYIFEWTRKRIKTEEINEYFPPNNHDRLMDKWKDIPKKLAVKEKLSTTPELNLSGLGELIKYRNGLVHARASRPATDNQPSDAPKPVPTKEALNKKGSGWALKIAVRLVEDLHKSFSEAPPDYLQI